MSRFFLSSLRPHGLTELAPRSRMGMSRLPGFIGPGPPPLWIRETYAVVRTCPSPRSTGADRSGDAADGRQHTKTSRMRQGPPEGQQGPGKVPSGRVPATSVCGSRPSGPPLLGPLADFAGTLWRGKRGQRRDQRPECDRSSAGPTRVGQGAAGRGLWGGPRDVERAAPAVRRTRSGRERRRPGRPYCRRRASTGSSSEARYAG